MAWKSRLQSFCGRRYHASLRLFYSLSFMVDIGDIKYAIGDIMTQN